MTRKHETWITAAGVLVCLAVILASYFLFDFPDFGDLDFSDDAGLPVADGVGGASSVQAVQEASVPLPLQGEVLPLVPRAAVAISPLDDAASSGDGVLVEGTVLGPDGEPLMGARVAVVPDGDTLAAAGFEPPPYAMFIGLGWEWPHRLDYVSLTDMPVGATDGSGRFAVPTPAAFAEAGVPASISGSTPASIPGGMRRGLGDPVVVITHPGLSAATPLARRTKDGRLSVGTLTLQPEAVLTGRVTDVDGHPIAGATVGVEGTHPADVRDGKKLVRSGEGLVRALLPEVHSTVTAADGSYRLGGLWTGATHVAAQSPGFSRTQLERVTLTAGEALALPDLVLAPGGVLAGRVVDADGRGLPGVIVLATASPRSMGGHGCVVASYGADDDTRVLELEVASEWGTLSTRTDERGGFRWDGVPPGAHTLYVTARGWEPGKWSFVKAGSTSLLLRMEREAQLQVRLVDRETLATVRGATLAARRISGVMDENTPLEVERADNGFLVPGVGRRGTQLAIRAPGYASVMAEVPGVAPAQRREVTLELDPHSRVMGVLTDERGATRAGLSVVARLPGAQHGFGVARCVSDSSGAYVLEGLPAGAYDITIGSRETGIELRSVEVGLGETAPLDVVVPRASRITGRLVSRAGDPLSGLSVELLVPQERFPRHATSAEDGSFVFVGLIDDDYTLSVKPRGSLDVPVQQGEDVAVELVLETEPVVRGRITSGGLPVEGASVRWSQRGRRPVLTDGDGRYELVAREAGSGSLDVQPAGGRWLSGPPAELDWGAVVEIDRSVPGAGIEGRVVDRERGAPVAEVTLVLSSLSPRDETASAEPTTKTAALLAALGYTGSAGGALATVSTDAAGRFVFPHLPAGHYEISLDPKQHARWLAFPPIRVELSTDTFHTLPDILLRAGGVVTGRVVRPSGVPASDAFVVRAWRVGEEAPLRSLRLVHGRFEVRGLADGTYRFATLDRYAVANDEGVHPDAGVLVEVVEGAPIDLRLVTGGG